MAHSRVFENKEKEKRTGGENWQEQAKQAASQATEKVSEAAATAASTVAGGMRTAGQTIRERGPHEGMLGSATGAVADSLESGSRYLEEQGVSGLAQDLATFVSRNPLPAFCTGVFLGYVIGRMMRS